MVMEIGNELSEKIRSAIKAKLVDLGAYVDDELPDYIMVMVANKKTQDQMTEDLNLFLGSNTEKFTAWLSALLAKLKAVTLGEAEKENEAGKEKAIETKVKRASSPVLEEETEPELTIRPERDEFEEEERLEKKKAALAAQSKTKTDSTKAKKITKHKTSPTGSSVKARLGSKVSPKTSASSSKYSSLASDAVVRKRKVPGSVVASVVKKDVDVEEEEYDPHKPMIGKVASTIRVGNRRSSVPVTHQASKSLVMKAVTEARASVEQRVTSKMVSDQMSRSIHRRLGDPPKHSRPSRSGGPQDALPPLSSRLSSERSVELFTKARQQEKAVSKHTQQEPKDDPPSPQEYEVDMEDVRHIKYEGAETREEDSREIAIKEDMVEGYPVMETLIQSGAEESDFTDDEIPQPRTVTQRTTVPERPSSPKFVVTLDGVDPNLVDKAMKSDDDHQEEDMEDEVLPSYNNKYKLTTQGISVRLDNDDDEAEEEEEEEEMETAKRVKKTERCRFWPACKLGSQCEYHHPTVACMMFPRCKYGDKCLYIHPNCKFDANCTRPNCPFTHASQRCSSTPYPVVIQPVKILPVAKPSAFIAASNRLSSSQSKNPADVKCRFYPKCTNMNCPFLHPKPCRYGISCMSKASCTFSHPPLPSKDQLKWMPPRQPNVTIQLDDQGEEH